MTAWTGPGRLTLSGPLDADHAPDLRPVLHAAAAAAQEELVLDLSDVPTIDATGLGLLVGARQRMRLREGTVRVVNACPEVAVKITRAGLWPLLCGTEPPQLLQGTVA